MEESDTATQPEPRIRHITGIGIHELSLPESESPAGLAFPINSGSPRVRRTSHVGLDVPIGRARAPTLAGEGLNPPAIGAPPPTPAVLGPSIVEDARPLLKCFVTLTIPDSEPSPSVPSSPRSGSPAIGSQPQSPGSRHPTPTRTRTISLPSHSSPRPIVNANLRSDSPTSPTFTTSPMASPTLRRSQMNGSVTGSPGKSRPLPVRRSTLGRSGSRAASDAGTIRSRNPQPVPFFFSPIHAPSTHPRWAHLESGDLAPWLTVPERAGTTVCIQVWIAEPGKESKWRKLSGVGGIVDLTKLVPIPAGKALPPNTIQWTLSTYPKTVLYLPPPGTERPEGDAVNRVVERSLRETRMKKGPTVGALHQLVNIQSVIADTQRSIEELQSKIDSLLASDADRAIERRDVSERALHVHWIRDRVEEVNREIEEGKARSTLQRGRLAARRALLSAALEREEGNRSAAIELSDQITDVESQRSALLPKIHRLRAMHAQALDAIFPIETISPPDLLYSILGVPLPIPLGPKDPAPPLSLPPQLAPEGCPRVDERTTAAALGYAAIVVHLISGLGGAAAGLAYPVTYAGSRSHVRDVVSAMQGPRSFPLYAKGVERYRYEYAVFLLNKDIEMLMLEADIKMVDLRHTLPNLKNLLLTLSSPDPPSPGPVSGPGWASGAASSASSRKPSAQWTFPPQYRTASTATLSPLAQSSHSVSLASASIHSVCPTNEDASMPSASTAVSPLPWSRVRAACTDLEPKPAYGKSAPRGPVGFHVGGPEPAAEEHDPGFEYGAESDGSDGTETGDTVVRTDTIKTSDRTAKPIIA